MNLRSSSRCRPQAGEAGTEPKQKWPAINKTKRPQLTIIQQSQADQNLLLTSYHSISHPVLLNCIK